MSPDETSTEAQTETGEADAEAKTKKSMKERMAFLDKGGKSMDKVPGLNKMPRSARVVLVIVVVLILLAAILYVAMPSGKEEPKEPSTLNVDKLQDWSYAPGAVTATFLNEGQTAPYSLSTMVAGNGTLFIDKVDVTITWTDEPDGSIGPRQKENQPDTFQLEINSSINVSAMSEEMSNSHGTSMSISLSVDISDSGYKYLVLGNTTGVKLGDDVITGDINVLVHMIVAGDHTSQPQILIINDFGNDYSIEISASGKQIPD